MSIRDVYEHIKNFFYPTDNYPITAKRIRFAYNNQDVLKGMNLTVKTSQIVAVVGKSGSGKSTFLNLISGVLTGSYKGKISVLGRDKNLAKEDIGFVPQELSIIPDLSIMENLAFFGSMNGLNRERALKAGKELMEIMQLELPLERYPSEMSGGQRVRLNIIVSILHNPKVIILDEPFVGLDYHNRKLLWHFLEHQRNRRKTVILTSHMLTEAEHHSNKIVLLHKGKIFAKGTVSDIRNKLNTYYILEIKFSALSKTNLEKIIEYCRRHKITLMDSFNNYVMFSIKSEGQKSYLTKYFSKIHVDFKELGFREPNMDELFLKVKDI